MADSQELGKKHDGEKLEYHLIPAIPEELVVRVLMFGKKKYGEDNWKHVPNAKVRYWDAARRHLGKILQGEILDPESGLPHAAHAICCLLFLLDPALDIVPLVMTNVIPVPDVMKTIDKVAEAYHKQQDLSTGCPYCPHPLVQHNETGCVTLQEQCPCNYRQRKV